jgi:hypothetical protein
MVIEKKLFLIKTTLLVHSSFYVEAEDIVAASAIAKKIVDHFWNEKVVATISAMDTPLLSWEEK